MRTLNINRPKKSIEILRSPYQVVNYTGSIYTVRNLVTNKLENVHVTNIRNLENDPLTVGPRKVANTDQEIFDIHEIIQHTGIQNRKAHMRFLVPWKDCDETWLPWSK